MTRKRYTHKKQIPKITNHNVDVGDLNSAMKYVVVQMDCGDEMSLQVRVNVGSRDETEDIKGISHLLEHMFFQGSKSYPTSKQLEKEIYSCGGNYNAYTDYHETVYHTEASVSCAETVAKIMSSSLYHSLLKQSNLTNEKNVVVNELRDALSNTEEAVSQNLLSDMFKDTRMEQDVGGTVNTVQKITCSQLRNFLNTYYSQDMIVVFCSSRPVKEGVTLLQRYFCKQPHYSVKTDPKITQDKTRQLYPDYLLHRTPVLPFRTVYIKSSDEQSFVSVGFPCCKYSETKHCYEMIILSEFLTGYMNSLLYTVLRQKHGLIYHIDSMCDFYQDMGLFVIRCTSTNQQAKVKQTVNLIMECITNLNTSLNRKDIIRVKKHLLKSINLSKNDPHSVGAEYAQDVYHLGKEEHLRDKYKIIQDITLNNLKQTCHKYLQPKLATVSYSGTSNYWK